MIQPLQAQFNSTRHKRLTSAKEGLRFRVGKQVFSGAGGGPESQLSNTRDVIQSTGYLTTMAGSNLDFTSNGK